MMSIQPACIWKLWQKPPPEERVHDVTGTVVSVTADELVIERKNGRETFKFVDSSIKGSGFGEGALVRVYYKILDGVKEITMVVEKVND